MWFKQQFGAKKAEFHGVRSQKAYISAGLIKAISRFGNLAARIDSKFKK